MFKVILRYFLGILLALAIGGGILLVNLIWFRPWNLNLFYEKVFAETVFREPEWLSSLGLVEQLRVTGHSCKLNDEAPARQQQVFERWNRDLAQLHEYSLDRQTASQRLSTRI